MFYAVFQVLLNLLLLCFKAVVLIYLRKVYK